MNPLKMIEHILYIALSCLELLPFWQGVWCQMVVMMMKKGLSDKVVKIIAYTWDVTILYFHWMFIEAQIIYNRNIITKHSLKIIIISQTVSVDLKIIVVCVAKILQNTKTDEHQWAHWGSEQSSIFHIHVLLLVLSLLLLLSLTGLNLTV